MSVSDAHQIRSAHFLRRPSIALQIATIGEPALSLLGRKATRKWLPLGTAWVAITFAMLGYQPAAFSQQQGEDPKAMANEHLESGRGLYDQGDLDGAMRECRAALRLDPQSASAHFLMGEVFGAKNSTDDEISEYRAAIRIDPKLADAHLSLGRALQSKKNDLEGAIAEYRASLRVYPDRFYANSFRAHSMLGSALAQKGDLDGAIVEFRRAISIKPDNPAGHVGLGMALQEKQQYEAAFAEFERALQLDPNSKFVRDKYDYLKGFLDKK